jgi:hypothetical protein
MIEKRERKGEEEKIRRKGVRAGQVSADGRRVCVGVATSACAWREAAWPQSADEMTRAVGAERD